MSSLDAEVPFHKVTAALRFGRAEIADWLSEYFGMNSPGGPDVYHLTRCKSAFGYGTMTTDDFTEFTSETIDELTDYIVMKMREW